MKGAEIYFLCFSFLYAIFFLSLHSNNDITTIPKKARDMTTNRIKTLIIRFENEIARSQISAFRGAIVSALDNDNVLFHNHYGDKLRYSYPLIQYKRIHKKAAIVCIGDGTEAISEFFTSAKFSVNLNGRQTDLKIDDIKAYNTVVQCWQHPIPYSLRGWLALNSENYATFTSTESLVERTVMLEKILIGNILSALKGMDLTAEDDIVCSITSMSEPRMVRFKNTKLMSIDVEFKSNISLPDFIGLGKHTSVGYGTLTRKPEKKEQ